MKTKVVLLGAGGIGSVHLNIYKKLEDVELLALVDVDTEKARSKAGDEKIRVYNNLDTMLLNEEPDMVDICTPSYMHAEQAKKIMEKGIHVLVEKPVALNIDDCKKVIDAACCSNVKFMVAQVLRFWPEYVWLKQVFDNKTYGRLKHISFTRIGEKPRSSWENWMLVPEKSGMVSFDLHIHDVDFMIHLLGIPESFTVTGIEDGSRLNFTKGYYQYPDCTVDAQAAWFSGNVPFTMSYQAIFEEAYINYDSDKIMVYENDKAPYQADLKKLFEPEAGTHVWSLSGYYNEINYFIRCIRDNTIPNVVAYEELISCLSLIQEQRKQYMVNS